MIKLPNMLIIGAAGRNTGKTELACSLIRKYSGTADIVGIKVTTVVDNDGTCPRGGEGCGVCSSLTENYLITEEIDTSTSKDTARLRAAGAGRVFWLRVLKAHLEEGVRALVDAVGEKAVCVCESNSMRTVVEPGIFIMTKDDESAHCKKSANTVIQYVDRTVWGTASERERITDDILLVDGRWILRE